MARYAVGAQLKLEWTVVDPITLAAVDPATSTVAVTQPDGTAVTPAPTAVKVATGSYYALMVPTQAGRHTWTVTTTTPAWVRQPDAFHVGASADAPLIGLADAKEHLRITGTADDAQLLAFCHRASDAADAYTGKLWRRTTVTAELHDGDGTPVLQLDCRPVLSVTSVTESGTSVASTGWVLDAAAGLLVRGTTTARSVWAVGTQNVSVTYMAGPAGGVVPDDVIQGALELLRHLWESQRGGSGRPRQGADMEYDPRQAYSVPRRVAELWDRHQSVWWVA